MTYRISEGLKPIPGEINDTNVDKYFQAFTNASTKDTNQLKLIKV